MLHTAAQTGIALFGITGVLLVNIGKPRWAPIFGLLGQPFWFYETFTAGQVGMFAMCFAYAAMWLLGVRTWWVRPWFARRNARRVATAGTGWPHPAGTMRPQPQHG